MASQLICCGIKFGWFDELVAHCQKVHAVQAAPTPQPASGGTPAQHSGSEDVEEAESNEGRHGESEENDEESNFEDDPQQAKKGSPTKKSKRATDGEFFCHIKHCGRSFSSISGVNSHINYKHPNATRDFKCTAKYPKPCKEAFYTKQSLDNHLKKAHKNTYVCKCSDWGFEDCEASFRALSDIKNHLETEHDQFVCRSTKATSCKFTADSQAALIDHYEFSHKEIAPAREAAASVAQPDISRFNVDRHGGFQSLAGRAGIQTKSQDRRSKGKNAGLQGTPRFPKGYQHHELSEGVVGRRREDDMDRNIAYHMGSISMISFNGTKSRGNPSPVKGGSVQGTSKGRFLAPSGNSGHLQKSLKGVLDGTRSHMHDRQSQFEDSEPSDDEDSDGFDEALAHQFTKAGATPGSLGSRAYANANLFKHTQIQPARRAGRGSGFTSSSIGSPDPSHFSAGASNASTPKPRKNNIYTRHDDDEFMDEPSPAKSNPPVVSDDETDAGGEKPIKKKAVQRLTLTSAEEDMLRYTGYFPHRQRYAKPNDISVAERERYELGKWTAHRTFEVRMEFHSHTDLNPRRLAVGVEGSENTRDTAVKFSATPNKGAGSGDNAASSSEPPSGSNSTPTKQATIKTFGSKRPYEWHSSGKRHDGVRDRKDTTQTPTKNKKKTAGSGTPKNSYGGLGNTKPVEERKTMLNRRKKHVVSAERIVDSDSEDNAETGGGSGDAHDAGVENDNNGHVAAASEDVVVKVEARDGNGEMGEVESNDLFVGFD